MKAETLTGTCRTYDYATCCQQWPSKHPFDPRQAIAGSQLRLPGSLLRGRFLFAQNADNARSHREDRRSKTAVWWPLTRLFRHRGGHFSSLLRKRKGLAYFDLVFLKRMNFMIEAPCRKTRKCVHLRAFLLLRLPAAKDLKRVHLKTFLPSRPPSAQHPKMATISDLRHASNQRSSNSNATKMPWRSDLAIHDYPPNPASPKACDGAANRE